MSLAELAEYPLIQIDQPSSWRHMLSLFQDRGLAATVGIRARSFELLRSLVAHEFGVAVVYSQPWGDRCYDGSAALPAGRSATSCRPSASSWPAAASTPPTAAGNALIAVAQHWFATMGPGGATGEV